MKFNPFVTSILMLTILTVLTGVVYPLVMTGICSLAFPSKAHGSIVTVDGHDVGSSLIGQHFSSARYFWSRPSATDYNTLPSSGSNWGPTADTLAKLVRGREVSFRAANALTPMSVIPSEMVFASGSGLDPHISPDGARLQIDRVLRARGWSAEFRSKLARLVEDHVEGRQFQLLGDPRVNVLMLNVALDHLDSNASARK